MVYTRSENVKVKKVLEIINGYKYKVNSSKTNCYHKSLIADILDQISRDVQANVGWDEVPSGATNERG